MQGWSVATRVSAPPKCFGRKPQPPARGHRNCYVYATEGYQGGSLEGENFPKGVGGTIFPEFKGRVSGEKGARSWMMRGVHHSSIIWFRGLASYTMYPISSAHPSTTCNTNNTKNCINGVEFTVKLVLDPWLHSDAELGGSVHGVHRNCEYSRKGSIHSL